MPQAVFQVDTYALILAQPQIAAILITSTPQTHGIVSRVTLQYAYPPGGPHLVGYVDNVEGLNYDGLTVYAVLPFGQLDRHYHVLQTEPLLDFVATFDTEPTNPDRPTRRRLRQFAFMTHQGPPGEQPEDADLLLRPLVNLLGSP